MVSVRVVFLRRFYFFKFSLLYFCGVFNKIIIPLALDGNEMIILSTISYPTRACGIIVEQTWHTDEKSMARSSWEI